MSRTGKKIAFRCLTVAWAVGLAAFLPGCLSLGGGGGDDAGNPVASQPYYPKDFREILIPDGLELNRDNTMYVKTESFNGGILSFDGRIETNSLTEFFEKSMPNNGWKLGGSVKSKNVLLIFTKPSKTCMITIAENKLTFTTQVSIYVSQELTGGGSSQLYSPPAAAPSTAPASYPTPAFDEPLGR